MSCSNVTRKCLPLFHDIRGSFDRDPGSPFDLVELFEVKHFLVTLEQLTLAYGALPPFQGITFPPMGDALALVDPEGRRLPAFAVVNAYHPGLAPLRAEKTALEKEIRAAGDEEKPALLEKRRQLAVQEEINMDENSIVWLDGVMPPDPHNYIVARKSASGNYTVFALKRVEVGQ